MRARSFAARRVASSATMARPPVRQQAAHDGQPVVRLVVQDPVGDADGLDLPGPHERRPAVGHALQEGDHRRGCHVERLAAPAELVAGEGSPRAPRRAPAGSPPADCTATMRGRASSRPSARASSNPATTADASAPPPTCTASVSSRSPASRSWSAELPAERLAALDGEAVLGALAGEAGSAPSAMDACIARTLGSPLRPGSRWHTVTRAPRWLRRSITAGSAPAARTRAASAPPPAPRPPPRAPRCRSSRWPAADRRALPPPAHRSPRATGQLQRDAHQVARLVGTGHVAGLVLDPHAARAVQPHPAAQRRGPEAVSVHGSDRRVEPLHERHVPRVRPARRARPVPRPEQRPVAEERVRLAVRRPARPAPGPGRES